jgi:glycosyltransferase involved in cell wall biosynthesis
LELPELRLAVVSPFLDRSHGTERALCEVLERLARDYSCEVHLFAQRVEGVSVVAASDANAAGKKHIVWHRVAEFRGPHLLRFIAWYFRNRAVRRDFVKSSGRSFDLVFSPGINCSDADVIIVHALFRRLRELSQKDAGSGGALRNLHRRIYYRLLAYLEHRIYSDPKVTLAAVSPRTKADLAKLFNRQDVTVIPNAVASDTFSPEARLARREEMRTRFGFGADEFVLLLIGNDWSNKGLPVVLKAMSLLPNLPLRLLVVGSDVAEPFRQVAAALGVLQQCRWETSATEVINFYAAADAYVSPSLEDSFGMPVSEAMACGLPAITSSCAGISAFVEDGVNAIVLQDPRDSETLAARLQEIYANIEQRQKIASAATVKAREWTWDRNTAQIWQLLNAAVAKNSHA